MYNIIYTHTCLINIVLLKCIQKHLVHIILPMYIISCVKCNNIGSIFWIDIPTYLHSEIVIERNVKRIKISYIGVYVYIKFIYLQI